MVFDWKSWASLVSAAIAALYTVVAYYRDKPQTVMNTRRSRFSVILTGLLALAAWTAVLWGHYDRMKSFDSRDIRPDHASVFIDTLSKYQDPGKHFHTVCFTDESCTIVTHYADALSAAGWTMGSQEENSLHTGIYILTRSNSASDHPPQAAALYRALKAMGTQPGWYLLPTLPAGDFALVIGPLN